MNSDHGNKNISQGFSFVEGYGIPDVNKIVNIIKFDEIRHVLLSAGLKEIQEFEDWYTYKSKNFDFIVSLNEEGNYFLEDRGISLEEYKQIVNMIGLIIDAPVSNADIEVVETIMTKFNLNLYNERHKKRYTDIREFKTALMELGLLKK